MLPSQVYALQTMAGHPNICSLDDVYADETVYALLLSRCFCNLQSFIGTAGPSSCDAQGSITQNLAHGIGHMHRHFILHRDLKPSNVLLRLDGLTLQAQVADFGSCAVLTAPAKLPSAWQEAGMKMTEVVTTYNYDAPEIFLENGFARYCFASDIWSLALIVAEIGEGKPIVSPMSKLGPETHKKVLEQTSAYVHDLSTDLSLQTPCESQHHTLVRFIREGLDSDPSQRMSAQTLHYNLTMVRGKSEQAGVLTCIVTKVFQQKRFKPQCFVPMFGVFRRRHRA